MKIFLRIIILFAVMAAGAAYWIFLYNNIAVSEARPFINIPTGADVSTVISLLAEKHIIRSEQAFQLAAQIKGYKTAKPGHYVFNRAMSNREILNMLQSGRQTPVKLVIYNIRTKDELAGLVGRTLEIDSVAFLARLDDPDFCHIYHLDTNNIQDLFIADSYEMKWNTHIDDLMARMKNSYEAFWGDGRRAKAREMGYNPAQVTTLASIVEKECMLDKELPIVAGVYLNRLRLNMPLQADPTLKFARKDFDAKRVTDYHKGFDSPYNTYLHTGLPPGPICLPRKKSIDAVLNPDVNDYVYFCANPDMSGCSVFSKTLSDQNKVAVQYRKKLDEMKVK
jgi:UPF0755 protein